MSMIKAYLDSSQCPEQPPKRQDMGARTRALHDGLDEQTRSTGVAYLHPSEPTLMLDLFGSDNMVSWQDAKGLVHFTHASCWSELPPVYGRYGTGDTLELIGRVKALYHADNAVVTDCGMQAVALTFDVLMKPGSHAICCRNVYNKSRSYLERVAQRLGGAITLVNDGDLEGIAAAVRPNTALLFCETFTNPLMRAQDPVALVALAERARSTSSELKLVIDDTIATAWAFNRPLLETGVDVVIGSGTKALGGQDTDMWGYVVTNDTFLANSFMDLMALRGGILDWRRARVIAAGLEAAESAERRRCANARRVAAFLAGHPRVAEVFHPSLSGHPDAAAVQQHYDLTGSLLSFRALDRDEVATRHLADVLITCDVIRYALSFGGLVTKVNHHQSVSEYFTPAPVLRKFGFDRLIRLGVGLEEADDLIAVLNWALWHGADLGPDQLASWRGDRMRSLGLTVR